MNAQLIDRNDLHEFSVLVSLYAAVHRHGLSHLYGEDIAYARLYRLLGVPRMRPVYSPGTDYQGFAQDVLEDVVRNAATIVSDHRSDPQTTPLNTLTRTTFDSITAESEDQP